VYAGALVLVVLAVFGLIRLVFGAYGEIQDDAIGCWHLNDNSDPESDSCGSNDGDLLNSPTYTNAGVFGGAYDFDSDDNKCINLGHDASLITGDDISIMAWINIDADSGPAYIVAQREGTSQNWIFYLNGLGLRFYGTDTANYMTASSSLSLDTWTHIAVAYDDDTNTGKLYINGEDVTDDNTANDIDADSYNTYIGARGSASSCSYSVDGLIDEVILWDRELSAAEIRQLYALQKGGYGIVD
jgi:hypothetical protein